jgi:RNA polymerase sigma-70 factor (ECF subfamily)
LRGNRPWSSEEELARARAGDRTAFASLVRAYQRGVYSLALRMLGSREGAEDLAQEVFLRLHGALASIESADHLAFWVRKVTTHCAIDRLRRPRIETSSLEEATEVAATSTEADPLFRNHLHRMLQGLQPAARAVMLLRFQEDLEPTEIANVLALPLNTVKSHLRRSLATLRELMKTAPAENTQSDTGDEALKP